MKRIFFMITEITFLPVRDARKLTPSPGTALISIHDDGEPIAAGVPTDGWGFFDSIGFDDAAYSKEQIEEYGEDFWNYFNGCARKVHALRLLVMFKQIEELGFIDNIIVHCDAGRSRSTAVAKFYAEKHGLELEGDTTYANSLIYQLLKNPDTFEEDFKKHVDKVEKVEEEKPSLFPLGWIDWLMGLFSKR